MAMSNPYQQYQQNSILAAKPEELTLMLYNGAIKFLKQAKIHIQNSEVENTHNCIVKTQNILAELMCSLDMEFELANNMYMLYDFMYENLIQADFQKFDGGEKKIDEVINLLEDFANTWVDCMKSVKVSQQKSS